MRGARRQRGPAAAPARRLPGRPRCHASPTGNVPQSVRDRILGRRPGPDRRHHGRDRRRGCPAHRRRPRPLPAPGRRLRPLPVKENRAVLFDQLDTLDWDETTNAAIIVHRTEETGRHEIRVVRVQPLAPGQVNFPHATRALLVERYTTGRGDGRSTQMPNSASPPLRPTSLTPPPSPAASAASGPLRPSTRERRDLQRTGSREMDRGWAEPSGVSRFRR